MTEYYVAGIISGITQTIIGHPFDTVKVYYQNSLKDKIKIRNLYRGLSYPLFTNSAVCSLNFGVFNKFRENYHTSNCLSGAISGIATSIVLTPIELYKIRKQLLINDTKYIPLFKGFSSCLLREIPAYATYFSSYYFLKDNGFSVLNSGGLAGILCWLVTYPLDVIKTRIQSDKAYNIMSAIKQGKLFRGISICLLRSYPVNAIGFFSYEYTLNIINLKYKYNN